MGAWRWFAAICASLGAGCACGADGLELAAKSRLSASRPDSAETLESFVRSRPGVARIDGADAPHAALPYLGGDPLVEQALREQRDHALARAGCRTQDLCYEVAEGRMVYRGARHYMPAWQGLAPEGISLRRDRLTLRYSFR